MSIPFLEPRYSTPHKPGELLVNPKWAYVPPVRPDFRLNLDREETTSNTAISLAEVDQRRQTDFPIQHTNRFPSKLVEDALTQQIAKKNGLEPNQILLGNGVMSIMTYIYSAYLPEGAHATVPTPGFWPAYTYAIQRGRGIWMPEFQSIDRASTTPSFVFPFEETIAALERDTTLCYLCNPNNPTGTLLPEEEIEALVTRFPEVVFILDEAYGPFAANLLDSSKFQLENGVQLLKKRDKQGEPIIKNLLVARTFSKVYAMANYRVGYVLGHPDLVATIRSLMGPYDASEIAIAMAYYNFIDDEYSREVIRNVSRNKKVYENLLERNNARHFGGYRNSILVDGLDLSQAYEDNGIAVRSMTYQDGIPNPISNTFRVAIPSDDLSFDLFIEVTEKILAERRSSQ